MFSNVEILQHLAPLLTSESLARLCLTSNRICECLWGSVVLCSATLLGGRLGLLATESINPSERMRKLHETQCPCCAGGGDLGEIEKIGEKIRIADSAVVLGYLSSVSEDVRLHCTSFLWSLFKVDPRTNMLAFMEEFLGWLPNIKALYCPLNDFSTDLWKAERLAAVLKHPHLRNQLQALALDEAMSTWVHELVEPLSCLDMPRLRAFRWSIQALHLLMRKTSLMRELGEMIGGVAGIPVEDLAAVSLDHVVDILATADWLRRLEAFVWQPGLGQTSSTVSLGGGPSARLFAALGSSPTLSHLVLQFGGFDQRAFCSCFLHAQRSRPATLRQLTIRSCELDMRTLEAIADARLTALAIFEIETSEPVRKIDASLSRIVSTAAENLEALAVLRQAAYGVLSDDGLQLCIAIARHAVNLDMLYLRNICLTRQDAELLTADSLSSLRQVLLHMCSFDTAASCQTLLRGKGWRNLQSLRLIGTRILDENCIRSGLADAAFLGSLRELVIDESYLSDKAIELVECVDFANLEHLRIPRGRPQAGVRPMSASYRREDEVHCHGWERIGRSKEFDFLDLR